VEVLEIGGFLGSLRRRVAAVLRPGNGAGQRSGRLAGFDLRGRRLDKPRVAGSPLGRPVLSRGRWPWWVLSREEGQRGDITEPCSTDRSFQPSVRLQDAQSTANTKAAALDSHASEPASPWRPMRKPRTARSATRRCGRSTARWGARRCWAAHVSLRPGRSWLARRAVDSTSRITRVSQMSVLVLMDDA